MRSHSPRQPFWKQKRSVPLYVPLPSPYMFPFLEKMEQKGSSPLYNSLIFPYMFPLTKERWSKTHDVPYNSHLVSLHFNSWNSSVFKVSCSKFMMENQTCNTLPWRLDGVMQQSNSLPPPAHHLQSLRQPEKGTKINSKKQIWGTPPHQLPSPKIAFIWVLIFP